MKKSLVAVLVLATCALFGCSDPYGASLKASDSIAKGINSGLITVLQLEQQGQLTPEETLDIAGYLEYANQGDEAFLTCIQVVHTNETAGGFTTCAQAFSTALTAPSELALIHASNSTALQNVNLIVNGVAAGVQSVVVALGGK